MIALRLDEVRRLAPGELRVAPGAEQVTGLKTDSRQIASGDLFVAVGGGAAYADEALAAGAVAALLPDDAFAALASLARAVRTRSQARVVGITGAVAKTSTKDILAALVRPHRRTVAAEGSQNNEVGLPLTLGRLEDDTEVAILELGMRGLGQIAELCEIAQPDVGVITKIGPVHLELLGTVERVAQAKAEVIAALPAGGVAVVPAGERLLEPYLVRDDIQITRFGTGGDVQLLSFTPLEDGSRVEVDAFGEHLDLVFPFASRHNAVNALAAVAAYCALGLPLADVGRGARDVRLSRWRGEEVPLPGGGVLINDAYNANPISVVAALEHLAARAGGRRRIAVLGEMAELGPDAAGYHREVGEAAARIGVDVLVAVGPPARAYLDGAAGVPVVESVATPDDALGALRRIVEPGDCVLVKASRSVGLESVADALTAVAA